MSRLAQLDEMMRAAENDQRGVDKRMDFWVENFGSQAASWLVWKHRKNFHSNGQLDFRIPVDATTPPWIRVAFETLRRRQNWSVTIFTMLKERVYRVQWHGWGTWRGEGRTVIVDRKAPFGTA